MKQSKLAITALVSIAMVAASASGPVMADEGDDLKGRFVKVSYEDLNLEKESGAEALYRRLQHASKMACGVEASRKAKSASAISDSYRCYRKVLTASVKKVDNALVTQIHEGN